MKIKAEILDRDSLTPREVEVFKLIAEGYPDKSISRMLGISIKTLERHIDRVYCKIGVQHRQMNARCLSIASAVARGMLKLSVDGLCVLLAVLAVSGQNDAVRVSGVRVGAVRVRVRELS
jgi:DNA-binding CsgD family transcriptional regulator